MEEEFDIRFNLGKLLDAGLSSEPLTGAWSTFYKKNNTAPLGTPRAYGIIALKKELIFNNFSKNIVPDTPVFGDAAFRRTLEFQEYYELDVDGIVGPQTAKRLFKKRILLQENMKEIPDNILCKQIELESGYDPGATGFVDPRDRGLAQINSYYHPNVTDDKAFDPSFSIPWSANYFINNFKNLKDYDAAIVAHNVGAFYAKKWLEAGKPSSGLYTTTGKDYASICTIYLRLVKTKTC